jgi:hypothetical protein
MFGRRHDGGKANRDEIAATAIEVDFVAHWV